MLQVEKATRIIDTSFRLHDEFYAENTQRYFCGIHAMSKRACVKKEKI